MSKKLQEYFKNDELASSAWAKKYKQENEETPDDKEMWKLCEDNKHAVSSFGRVMNVGTLSKIDSRGRKGKLKPFILKNRLSSNTYYITYNSNFVHRLVAKAFIPNPNNYKEVNHKDGNKANNHIDNLEWVTRNGNIKHAYDTNLRIKDPEESSKLTREEVNRIRTLYKTDNYSQKDLALKFNVKQQQISKIVNYKQWK